MSKFNVNLAKCFEDNIFNLPKHLKKLDNNSIEFACATLSFCPDICCGKAFLKTQAKEFNEKDCRVSSYNPCKDFLNGACELSITDNKEYESLKRNILNASCFCENGFHYIHGLNTCVDIDECIEQNHDCIGYKQTCMNTKGGFICSCEQGYTFLNTIVGSDQEIVEKLKIKHDRECVLENVDYDLYPNRGYNLTQLENFLNFKNEETFLDIFY